MEIVYHLKKFIHVGCLSSKLFPIISSGNFHFILLFVDRVFVDHKAVFAF